MWKALKAYDFPDFYINALKTVYNNIEACVVNGGTTSKYFKISRGARQGDPMSAILFIVALEILLIQSVHWAGCTLRDCLPSNLIAHYEFHYESEDV